MALLGWETRHPALGEQFEWRVNRSAAGAHLFVAAPGPDNCITLDT
ncbi:MAG: hypothetical protein ACRDYY_04920 [Acidimicrobiales bacterium]